MRRVLDLVSFINMMELLLPSPPHSPPDQTRFYSPESSPNSVSSSATFGHISNLDGTIDGLWGINECPSGPSSPGMKFAIPPGKNTQPSGVRVNEATHIVMVDNSREPTTVIHQDLGRDKPNSRFWNVNRPDPNARTAQFLPFQRLSMILSSSLSGVACPPESSCSIPPISPPQYPHAIVASRYPSSTSGKGYGQLTPQKSCSPGIGTPPLDDSPVSLQADTMHVGKNALHGGFSAGTSGTLGSGPLVEVTRNSKPFQRPKNPMSKILEEEHQKLESAHSPSQRQASQLEPRLSQDATSILHSQPHILSSLFVASSPRPKPTATDTLLYWLLQDHTVGEDVPTFSRTGDQKSLFRLMMCLWAEPIVGSGPFDKEWKRLLREREMRRWSEVGGEAEVNVISILVMMSLFGAEVGLGICRGGSKIHHKRLPRTTEVAASLQGSEATDVALTPRSVSMSVRGQGGVSGLPKQERDFSFCPVCKKRRKDSVACPCARALLQGMGVLDPVITLPDTMGVPAPLGSRRGRSIGRRSSHKAGQHSGVPLDSNIQSLPPISGTPATTSVDLLAEPAVSPPNRTKSQNISNPLESSKCIFPKIQEWLVDENASLPKTDAIDQKSKSKNTPTLALATDSDNTNSPGIIMGSRDEDSSVHEPLLLNTITSMTLSTCSSDFPEVGLNPEADINSTLFGATAKLYAETPTQSTSHDTLTFLTPPLLAVPPGCQPDCAADQLTPLTNIEINVQLEDDRMPKSRDLSWRGIPKPLACGANLDHNPSQDEDCPPEWVKVRSQQEAPGR